MTEIRGAIVVGASSGIGEALARTLAEEGYEVGLTARRTERLRQIGTELPTKSYVATMDVTNPEDARAGFVELAEAMPSVDLVVVSAGVGDANHDLEWETERRTIDVNVRGFAAIASAAVAHFEETSDSTSERDGHLVGISSVAARFGTGGTQAYNASKAFVSTYLEGLRSRQRGRESDVTITTVEPGFVDTDLAYGTFWDCQPETAATQIARAIRRGRTHVYVTRRWRLIAWFFELVPSRIIQRLL
ncbi:Short-chain dehydrogenase [Natronorubrum sediminis]|uniref:Short-chain dehydrogenase n=1 Tax=Natronorubrum sediminis TaxID=640943 RepID=A0A1H6FYW2_9EURY|nr:SDR family NAD(P)-dependent oxidoreductase [Natronorubrum sediminis]SEH15398.1 Short-chain dehydrogenase [Natronorubrum sediminis]